MSFYRLSKANDCPKISKNEYSTKLKNFCQSPKNITNYPLKALNAT